MLAKAGPASYRAGCPAGGLSVARAAAHHAWRHLAGSVRYKMHSQVAKVRAAAIVCRRARP